MTSSHRWSTTASRKRSTEREAWFSRTGSPATGAEEIEPCECLCAFVQLVEAAAGVVDVESDQGVEATRLVEPDDSEDVDPESSPPTVNFART